MIRTVSVDVVPFAEVDESFAAAEGEGDLTLDHWRECHWRVFAEELAAIGRVPQPDMPVVCERFELVFPAGPSLAQGHDPIRRLQRREL